MSKIALFSDLHLGVHGNSSEWLQRSYDWCEWFVVELKKHNIKKVFFLGDWFHNRSDVSVSVLSMSKKILNLFNEHELHLIVGNHDCYYKHSSDVNSVDILEGSNIIVYKNLHNIVVNGVRFGIVPWGADISKLKQNDVILGHLEVESFQMNTSYMCSDGIKVDSLLKKAPLVFSGHFHKRSSRSIDGKQVIYIGNPFQMDFGDAGDEKGFYIVNLSDSKNITHRFVVNNAMPMYVNIKLSELAEQKTITKAVEKAFNNNYIKLNYDVEIAQHDISELNNILFKLNPKSITPSYSFTTSTKNDNGTTEDFSFINIESAINEFINILNIDNKNTLKQYVTALYSSVRQTETQ